MPVLIFANKQDLPNAMTPEELAGIIFAMEPLQGMWCVQGCIALTGEGVFEGFDWLSWAVQENYRRTGVRAAPDL